MPQHPVSVTSQPVIDAYLELERPSPAPAQTPVPVAPSPRAGRLRMPKYRLHRPSGRAVVTIAGRDHYLGTYGSYESRAAYDRLVAEWLARGRPRFEPAPGPTLTVNAVVLAYWRHAKATYTRKTSCGTIAPALRRLRRLFGELPAAEFGPKRLRSFQQALVLEGAVEEQRREEEQLKAKELAKAARRTKAKVETAVEGKQGPEAKSEEPKKVRAPHHLSRRYVNRSVAEVKRCFKWAVCEELIPASHYHGLQTVEALRIGRTDAPETKPVAPVLDSVVEATLPHLSPLVADMVRVQRLTGMRPGEVCAMRVSELDMSGEVWMFRPTHHKTAHHGKGRAIPIGPKARAIVERYIGHDLNAYLFRPAEAMRQRFQAERAARVTKVQPSQVERARRAAKNPRRRFRERYTTAAYELAISRGCVKAGVPHWSPNQLRHTRATELRKQFGLDAASAVLGHAKVETTQIYAEKNMELAAKVALATG